MHTQFSFQEWLLLAIQKLFQMLMRKSQGILSGSEAAHCEGAVTVQDQPCVQLHQQHVSPLLSAFLLLNVLPEVVSLLSPFHPERVCEHRDPHWIPCMEGLQCCQ